MALINCPECQREISDTVKACPHCGYSLEQDVESAGLQKVEIAAVSLKAKIPSKTLRMVISVVLVSVIGFAGLILLIRQRARSEYIDNLNLLSTTMLSGAGDSEALCNLIAQVWSDTIYQKYNGATAKYTIMKSFYSPGITSYSKYAFEDDFNTSLAKLFADADTVSKVNSIKANRDSVDKIMKGLKSPTPEFERCYATVQELFGAYQGLTGLAIDASGNLQTFSQSKNDRVASFLEYHRRLGTQIPEK